ncbi:hypothetical protein QO010_000160 [Caulobacter ginsengisoli]|uniref:Polymerase nucleotidyl transferase domain-containing protein n=1 Tax=Caulobacter ginsengisoli TaxID=400775 RepID=A0ABU0IK98_9CAUL|nr:hypothetical protein [Caulobacter ginsengisoli]MDQ0462412.1 hypothetical protein [Caulobacter ginsengisoli]
MGEGLDILARQFELWSRAALDEGQITLFNTDIARASFVNASPVVVAATAFRQAFGQGERRAHLVAALETGLAGFRAVGARVTAVIVGGSFIDQAVAAPKDLDCVIFYEAEGETPADEIAASRAVMLQAGVDARPFPCDVSIVLTLKVALFFNNLYAADRAGGGPGKGCVLLVPDGWPQPATAAGEPSTKEPQ